MKAAFVAPTLNVGGAERQWSTLIPELVDRGIAAEVFTLDGEGLFFDELLSRGIRTECIWRRSRLGLVDVFKAAGTIAERSPDVVLTTGVSAHVVGHLASRRAKASHVAAMHGIPNPFSARQKVILRVLASRVTASTVVTEAQRGFLSSLGFRQDGIWVIPNGVAALESQRPPGDVRVELGIGESDFLAVLVAALRTEKRVDRFVKAVVQANGQDPRIRGIVAGGGPELVRVRASCAETRSVVQALGQRADTPDLIRASDVVCLTSDAEALPFSLLEAMALGRPVVTTDVGGVRDAVVEGETGFVVEPDDVGGFADALVELVANPKLASRLGEAGRRRQQQLFTVDRMVEAHVALFEHLAGR